MIGDISQYQALMTAAGRNELIRVMRAFRERYGERWFEEFKAGNPDYVEVVDLCANHDFETAFAEMKKMVAGKIAESGQGFLAVQFLQSSINFVIDAAKNDLELLHSMIKAEIDRPRF